MSANNSDTRTCRNCGASVSKTLVRFHGGGSSCPYCGGAL